MADYILREAAIKSLEKFTKFMPTGNTELDEAQHDDAEVMELAMAVITNIVPAADVVEVVRCKDCRFFHNGYDEKCCVNHKGVVTTDENGFCHHAERRCEDYA